MNRKKRWFVLLIILTCALALPACSSAGGEEPEVTTLIYANLTEGGVDRAAVTKFNNTHSDVQIEVRDYFTENGHSGWERLMTEMAAGKIPDIIDIDGDYRNRLPYHTLARKGVLEDLWPYIETDPGLGREAVLEAPLKAAEVDGGLYAIFSEVMICTVVGAKSIVGDRTSWTLADLQEAFSTMPEDSTILEYCSSRSYIFGCLFPMSLDGYIDWDAGESRFDSEQFRAALQFVNSFPEDPNPMHEDPNAEIVERIFSGRQMLSDTSVTRPHDFQALDAYYGRGEPAVCIGYPTEDGSSGNFFQIMGNNALAMSSTCQDKEAAWEFMRKLLLPRYKNLDQLAEEVVVFIPVNRADFDLLIECDRRNKGVARSTSISGGPDVKFRKSSQEEVDRYMDLLNSVDKINLYDSTLLDIVNEAILPYFAGDKTLDETVQTVNSRVKLYLDEQR